MTATAKTAATVAVPTNPAKFPETAIITVTPKGAANPKRGKSAARYAGYKTGMTVGAYLDHCAIVEPEEPRYRWRADIAWDLKRGYIEIAAPKA